MHNTQTGTSVASWSAHHIPPGSSIRYVLNPAHDAAPIRLVIGDFEQVELELALTEAVSIATALREAEQTVRTRITQGAGPDS